MRRITAFITCFLLALAALTTPPSARAFDHLFFFPVNDIDGNRYADLVVGSPDETVNGIERSGVIHVVYGSEPGLDAAAGPGAQMWTQADVDENEARHTPNARFGASIALGKFDSDHYTDIAVGAPGLFDGAGAVYVIYGSPAGLSHDVRHARIFYQDIVGVEDTRERGDQFGHSLAAGDFNDDGVDDLAVGVPGESIGSAAEAGAVNILYGSATGIEGTNGPSVRFLHQDLQAFSGLVEAGDRFGEALAAGNLGPLYDDGDDLVIGSPGEDVSATGGTAVDAGMAQVVFGSRMLGLDVVSGSDIGLGSNQALSSSARAMARGRVGSSLATGRFNTLPFVEELDDVAVGMPGWNVDHGAVLVFYSAGVNDAPTPVLTSGRSSFLRLPSSVLEADGGELSYGAALAAGDFDSDGDFDLAIGAPNEDNGNILNAGAVYIRNGSSRAFSSAPNAMGIRKVQGAGGIQNTAEASDHFGATLAAANYAGAPLHNPFGVTSDLAIGAPNDQIRRRVGLQTVRSRAGSVTVLYGRENGGLDNTVQIWHQDSADLPETAETSDSFGGAAR